VQLPFDQIHRELVLRPGQRHLLRRSGRERNARQLPDALGQPLRIQRPKPAERGRRIRGRQQAHRAGRFTAVVGQQPEGIGHVGASRAGEQGALGFFRQQVVEEPLHRAPAARIGQRLGLQG
jgi:hypothetical protein